MIGMALGLAVGAMATTGVVAMAMWVAATEDRTLQDGECECCR